MKRHKHLILVTGTTHSGTSVLTKGLETMGISLGPALTFQDPFEQRLLWEDPELHTLNLEILSFFGAHLREIIPLTEEEVEILSKEGFLTKASQLLLEKFPKNKNLFSKSTATAMDCVAPNVILAETGIAPSSTSCTLRDCAPEAPSPSSVAATLKTGSQPLGIKDPRFSILLPFWKKVFQQCNIQASFIIALRNPWSVAAAQKQHMEKSFWIWISHLLSCLEHSEGHQRLLVDYDTLLNDPKHQMERIAQKLKLNIDQDLLASYCHRYVDPTLRHFHEKKEVSVSLPFYQNLATEMYTYLLRVAHDKIDFQKLKQPLQQWKKEYVEAQSLLVLAEKNNATIHKLKSTIQQLDTSIHELHKEINQKTYSIAHYCQEIHQREIRINALLQKQKDHDAKHLELKIS
ncbi:MAG: sulfotransferase family protein [Chthoniobacterales bacterium]